MNSVQRLLLLMFVMVPSSLQLLLRSLYPFFVYCVVVDQRGEGVM